MLTVTKYGQTPSDTEYEICCNNKTC